MVEVARARPRARGGTRRRRAAPGAAACTSAAIEPAGGSTGDELAADASRARSPSRSRSCPRAGRRGPWRWRTAASQTVASTTRSASAASWLVPGSRPATRSPHCSRSSSTTLRARLAVPRPDDHVVADGGQPRRDAPAPPAPSLPTLRSSSPRASHTPRPRSPPARPTSRASGERVRMRHRSDGWCGRRSAVVPPRHRASHAERPHRTDRTPPARPRHQPPGTRRRLRATAGASASRPAARTRAPRRLPGRRCARTPGDSHSWPHASPRPERLRVVPVGGRALGPRGLRARRRSRSRCRDPTALGSTASIVHESTVFGPVHLGIVDGIPVASAAPDAVRSHRGRPAVDDRARGGRGLAAQDRRPQDLARVAAATSRVEGDCAAPSCERSSSTGLRATTRARAIPSGALPRLLVRAGLPAPTLQHRVRRGAKTVSHRPLLSGAADRDRVRQLEAPFGPLGVRPRPGPRQRPRSPRVPPAPLHVDDRAISRSSTR